jgi:aspartyl-tRNA(Asn)/glutamyl-tRNA(Gln) amidotransferase subunit B
MRNEKQCWDPQRETYGDNTKVFRDTYDEGRAVINKGWEVVVGLEVHAQILTKSKLFSRSPANFGSEPTTQVSFYDAAMPGTLPVLNEHAVDQAIKTGLSVKGTINKISRFDRKNYFYPDLPAGYQISQLYYPIITGGRVDIDIPDGTSVAVNLDRIHIEQDAGKSIHDLSTVSSHIDLNRSGTPLMEIVSMPDMRSSQEAMEYLKKLRMILRYIGTCDGNMERGNLRADANVSVRRTGEPLGPRVEVKNINSIKFLGQAIDFESERQICLNEKGRAVIQETRLYDSCAGETRSMRTKENSDDYRYFPDPDLKPLVLSVERIERNRRELPELPDEKKARFIRDYGITQANACILTEEKLVSEYFEVAVKASKSSGSEVALRIANWIVGELFAFLNKNGLTIDNIGFPIEYISELVDLITDGTISGKIAKTVFANMTESFESPSEIVRKHGLVQVQDESVIRDAIQKVLNESFEQVNQYRSGKLQLFGFFVGKTMKELNGKCNPEIVSSILKELL